MPATAAARSLHEIIEPIHTTLYFATDVKAAWETLGLEPMAQGYVAGRAAPMGAVGPESVAATFFNFSPVIARFAVPAAWEIVTPGEVLDARAAAIEALFTRVGAPTDGLAEATELARTAAAAADLAGRPLAAGNAAVAAPGTPFADLWQALTVLREHRGDGHVALLTTSGLHPVEVLAVYAAWQGQVSRRFLQRSRAWDDDAWQAAQDSLVERGWVDGDGDLTTDGRAWRDRLEGDTDRLAAAPYDALGADGCRRLFDLLHPIATSLDGAEGVFPKPLTLRASFDG